MERIEDYFSSLRIFFRKHKAIIRVEPESPFQRITDHVGQVEVRLIFFDGSYLDVGERVRIERGHPVASRYRYHYQRPEGRVFTYDDAPHHHELETSPHHKHLYRGARRTTQANPRVSLTTVIKEVLLLLK